MNSKNWILITGGTGFVGFALTKYLLALGHPVRIISRSNHYDNAFEDLIAKTSKSKLEIFNGDIRVSVSIERAFENVSHVFHVAALVNSVLPYCDFEVANVTATKNICELCLENDITKLVYISTSDVFGLPEGNSIFTESSPYKYWSEPYADTKIEATKLVKKYMRKGLKTTIIYPGWVYGPGDKALLPSILKQLRNGMMPIWDGGKFEISFIYIDDLIEAMVQVLKVEQSDNEDFLILDESSHTNLEGLCIHLGLLFDVPFKIIKLPYFLAYSIAWLSQKFCQFKLSKTPIMSTNDVKSFGHAFKFSTEKAKTLLGWSVNTELKTGLEKWKSWSVNVSK